MHLSLVRWSVKWLSDGIGIDRPLAQGNYRSSSTLLKVLQNLTEPTSLTLDYREIDEMFISLDDRRQETVSQDLVLDELRVNCHVTELHFDGFRYLHVMDQILEANQSIARLTISLVGRCVEFEAIRGLLKRGPQIELTVSHICQDNPWFVSLADAIQENSTLTSLSLSCGRGSGRRNKGKWVQNLCMAVRTCFALSELHLNQIDLGNPHSYQFGEMLTENETIIERNMDALVKHSNLKKLCLKCNSITDFAGDFIAEALRVNSALVELDLTGNTITQPHFFRALQQNTTLTMVTLEVRGTAIGLETSLTEMIRLNSTISELSLTIDFTLGDEFARALSASRSLRVLDLAPSKLSFASVEAIGQALISNRSLVKLRLSVVNVSAQDSQPFKVFCEGLKVNDTLKTLWYRETTRMIDHQANGMISIADALAVNTGLEKLILCTADMTSYSVAMLAVGLQRNKTLKMLELKHCDELYLPNNWGSRLTVRPNMRPDHNISLRSCFVEALKVDGGRCFADALTINTSLEELLINSIRPPKECDVVISALVNALKVNKSIKRLGLHHDFINNQRLMETYRDNPTLTCQFFSKMIESPVTFYNRLNQTGRCSWTDSNFPDTLWSRALVLANARSSSEGQDLLFYFIAERPDIFKGRC